MSCRSLICDYRHRWKKRGVFSFSTSSDRFEKPELGDKACPKHLLKRQMIQYLTLSFTSALLSSGTQQERVCGVGAEDPVPTVHALQGFTSV